MVKIVKLKLRIKVNMIINWMKIIYSVWIERFKYKL